MALRIKRAQTTTFSSSTTDSTTSKTLVDRQLGFESATPALAYNNNGTIVRFYANSGTTGSTTGPVYFSAGKPVACGSSLAVSITGNAATATSLATARTIALSGHVSGSASFNGSANATISTTLATVTASDTTSTSAPAHSGTFTAVDSVTRDSYGRVTGINTKTITLPADNNTTYTAGTGISISGTTISCSVTNTDTKVTQTSSSTAAAYPILLAYSSAPTSGTASTAYYNTGITANPSTGTITAKTFSGSLSGTATSATYATSAESASTATTATSATSATSAGYAGYLSVTRYFRVNLGSTASATFNGTANCTPGVTGTLGTSYGGTGNTAGRATTALSLCYYRYFRTNLASTSCVSFNGTTNITPGVTGILPVANGGTGNSTGTVSSCTTATYATALSLSSTTSLTSGSIYLAKVAMSYSDSDSSGSDTALLVFVAGGSGSSSRAMPYVDVQVGYISGTIKYSTFAGTAWYTGISNVNSSLSTDSITYYKIA